MWKLAAFSKIAFVYFIALNAALAFAQTSANDPSGTWRWKYDVEGKTREDSVSLQLEKGKITGSFLGQLEKPVEIKDASWKDNQLHFTAEYKQNGQAVTLEFSGKTKLDELDGSVKVTTESGTDEYPWKPKRTVELDDVVGQWDISIDADGNQLSPKIVITKSGQELLGKYTVSDQSIVDATKLKIKDNKLQFHVEGEFQGRKIIADYSGRPYGNTMQGKIDFNLDGNQGEINFSAKRQPVKKTN